MSRAKEFYADFFAVKNPNENGTTINRSVWVFAEAYHQKMTEVCANCKFKNSCPWPPEFNYEGCRNFTKLE